MDEDQSKKAVGEGRLVTWEGAVLYTVCFIGKITERPNAYCLSLMRLFLKLKIEGRCIVLIIVLLNV